MTLRSIVLVGTLLVAACTTPEQNVWSKRGYSAARFEQDSGRCRELAKALVGDVGTRDFRRVRQKLALRNQLYASCLEELGYRWGPRGNAGKSGPSQGRSAPSEFKRWNGSPSTTKT
jgi:hypothetical protein